MIHETTRTRELLCREYRCDGCGVVLFVVFPDMLGDQHTRIARNFVASRRVALPGPTLALADGTKIPTAASGLFCTDTLEACEAQALAKGWVPL